MNTIELPPGLPITSDYQTLDLPAYSDAISLDGLPLGDVEDVYVTYYLTDHSGNYLTDHSGNRLIANVVVDDARYPILEL